LLSIPLSRLALNVYRGFASSPRKTLRALGHGAARRPSSALDCIKDYRGPVATPASHFFATYAP
jgi:hypothetical protein